MSPVDTLIDAIVDREGGYVDHPADRGGPTKFGITRATLASWRGRPVVADEVAALTRAEAVEIYRALYVIRPGFHRIADASLRAQVIDAGVLHGTGWAARRLQEAAGVPADGLIGPVTLAAVNFADRLENGLIARRFAARRIRKIARIVRREPSQLAFLVGWIDRATSFLEQ